MKFRKPRWPVDFKLVLFSADGEQLVTVRNVGRHGLCLTDCQDLRKGQDVKLLFAGTGRQGRVEWVRKSLAGVHVDRALGEVELAMLRQLPRRAGAAGAAEGLGSGTPAGRSRET
ncbi:hypothetical protein AIOL_000605 [Candidatus Rhodobacter oscarellae]|uniref:PilZ domain-containing protein n=1 Tax=Candidatus Rhodobacter oscarellae TaxID=1675527 RepID=A0A0J9ECH5_9RHOB|nr:hypothetical protein [Candidatus Rhodobacter lobularis]KMW60450.1 hypothetical protein AIOL_000605 [Candidatus Rhodobacter lobularis]